MTSAAWLAAMVAGSGVIAPAIATVETAETAGTIEPPTGTPITDPRVPGTPTGLGHAPDAQAAFNSPTVLFVNFDGPLMNVGCGNNSHQDCSTLFGGVQFDASPADASLRAAVVQAVREDVVDFGVIVVGERPPESNPYAMVVVGTPAGGAPAGVGGVAPGVDCGNDNPNLTSFSFLVNANANTQATVIHQEAAHTWGLEHVDDPTDNLFPSTGGAIDPKYQDVCSTVVADPSLTPVPASCNEVHSMFCPDDQQNSYREMLLLFGPPIPDLVAPSVIIEVPEPGEVIEYADDFELTVTLDDDRRPQIIDTTVFVDDVEAADATLIDATHTFPVNGGDPPSGHGLSNGLHRIRVDIVDESGNVATDEVTIEIVGSPFGDPDGQDTGLAGSGGEGDIGANDGSAGGTSESDTAPLSGDRGSSDEGCGCRTDSTPAAPGSALALLLLAAAPRRRRGVRDLRTPATR